MPEAMDTILAILGYNVMQEAKALALQKEQKRDKDKGILTQNNIQSHNIAYQVFEDSCLDQGLPRLVGMFSAALGHLS